MKKVIALLLGLGLVVGTIGCENKPKPSPAAGGGAGGGGAAATPAAGGSPTAPNKK